MPRDADATGFAATARDPTEDQAKGRPQMAKVNPAQFIQQVRAEASKVVWPSRKETTVTTTMVFVMATVAALFFFAVDMVIGLGIDSILGIAG
jgi:preprotein translocase subunit SecE